MPAAITTFTILGPTNLDPDVDHNSGVDGNGWVVMATMPEIVGATFDPSKIVVNVTDPGFTNGIADRKPRAIRGGKPLRRQWPNEAQPQSGASGGVFTAYFTLRDDVFGGSLIVDVQAEPDFYKVLPSGTSAASGAVTGPVNQSTLAYPPPLIAWGNLQHERAVGATFPVELFVAHRFARNGRAVDCVEFTAKDAQASPNSSAMIRALIPTLSDFQTQGQRAEAYKATLALDGAGGGAALAQGDICTVNAVVKPWIGDAWDLSANAVAWPTSQTQTLLRFKNDKTGAYGGAHVAVKAGAAGGSVQASYALSLTTPFPTLNAALLSLPAWNNTNKGHNNHSGASVWLMDDGAGGAVDHVLTANGNPAAGDCWTDIAVDPAATGQVRLKFDTANRQMASLLRYRCPLVFSGPGTMFSGNVNANLMLATDGASLIDSGSTAGSPRLYCWGLGYHRNLTCVGSAANWSPGEQFGTTRAMVALALGIVATGATANLSRATFQALIGCRFNRLALSQINLAASGGVPNADAQDGSFIANNITADQRSNHSLGEIQDTIRGMAIVQNVFERAGVVDIPTLTLGQATTAEHLRHANIVMVNNTIPGTGPSGANPARNNMLFSAEAEGIGLPRKDLFARYNLFYDWNHKTDVFTDFSATTGRVSNWALRHGVAMFGNVAVLGGDNGNTVPGPSNWTADYWEPGSKPGAAAVTFTDNKAGSTGALGNGTYSLTGATNDAYNRVPAGMAALSYDIAGKARLNDGSGAAGAYERDLTPIGGAASITEPGDTLSSTGAGGRTGSAAITEPGDTASGGGKLAITAGGTVQEGGDTAHGEATLTIGSAPISDLGPLLAGTDRIVAVGSAGNGYTWGAAFDPSDRAPYGIDWTSLIPAGDHILQIDRITMSPQGASLGVKVDTSAGRSPVIEENAKLLTQLWFVVDEAFQDDAAFAGAGVPINVSVLIRTSGTPYEQFERTATLIVRQQ